MRIERKWCMPNKNTFLIKPISELVIEEITEGVWLDPFANENPLHLHTVTNDLNASFGTHYNMDALEFLKQFKDSSVDGVLFDPPYSPRQIKESYESVGMDTQGGVLTRSSFWSNMKIEIARIVKPGGRVLCFGWNSMGIGLNRGFDMSRILMVAHGGHHNDTIVTVETKRTEDSSQLKMSWGDQC